MKKYLFTFIFLLQLTHFGDVYASGALIGATEPTQILNNVELGLDAGFDLATSLSTTIDMTKNTILDPIANALITNALNSASGDIMSWVSGGFSGGAPLIIANPQKYIEGQGLNAVKGALGNIPMNSAFGDSIFSSVLSNYKGSTDIASQLKALSQSNVPGILQNSMCTDAQLTALAKQSVSDVNNAQEVAARKTALYAYACQGNPNDPQTAARLNDLSKQNPNLGGWDAWLNMTGGNNGYTNSKKAIQVVAQQEAIAKDFAIKENFGGGQNAVSQKECIEYEPATELTDPNSPVGPTQDQPCKTWSTVTPGKTVTDLLSKASGSGLDRLSNIMGAGSLTGMLSNLAMSAITGGIKKALGGIGGGGKMVNVSTTIATTRPVEPDLAADPTRKAELLVPMMKQIDYYSTTLTKLESTDQTYITDLSAYEGRVQSGKACFDGLVKSGITTTSHPAFGFYASRQNTINGLKNPLLQEMSKIGQARQLIAATTNGMNSSNSSQEIGTIFNKYLTAVDNQQLPDIQAEPNRRGEYQINKSNMSRDTDIATYQATCTQMQQTQYYNSNSNSNQ